MGGFYCVQKKVFSICSKRTFFGLFLSKNQTTKSQKHNNSRKHNIQFFVGHKQRRKRKYKRQKQIPKKVFSSKNVPNQFMLTFFCHNFGFWKNINTFQKRKHLFFLANHRTQTLTFGLGINAKYRKFTDFLWLVLKRLPNQKHIHNLFAKNRTKRNTITNNPTIFLFGDLKFSFCCHFKEGQNSPLVGQIQRLRNILHFLFFSRCQAPFFSSKSKNPRKNQPNNHRSNQRQKQSRPKSKIMPKQRK